MKQEHKVIVGLTLAWLLLYVLGNNFLVITDPVEGNYAETAREMLAAGDYFSPQIYGNYWYDKPIMFYLELIAAFKLFGLSEFSARFFPAIMSWCGIMLTYWTGKRFYNQRTGLYAAVLMMLSLEYWYLGHAVITDMTLFIAESVSLIGFYIAYTEKNVKWYYAAFAASGIAVLTKGPIGLCLPGLIIMLFLLWQRDFKFLFNRHTLGGFVLFFAVVSLWYVPMYLQHGSDFILTFLGVHNVLRATVSEHPRDDVWYYYTLIFMAGFFPWSFVFVPAKIRQWFKKRPCLPQMPRERFLLLWAVTVFVVFQSFATKYVSYTFPYMIPVALLMVSWFQQHVKLFTRMAGAMAVTYVALLFLVAAPIMHERSAHDIAVMVKPHLTADTQVYCFNCGEPASFAFYTETIPRRLESRERINAKKNKEISWDAKNVMSLTAYDEVSDDSPVMVITGGNNYEALKKAIPGQWQSLGAAGEYQVYYRPAAK